MGRYDLGSVGSMLAFFTIGVMYAAFMLDGTAPCSSDQLNSWQRNGANRSTLFFSNHVGSGSIKHCLSGSACIILVTSDSVTGVNRRSSQPIGRSAYRRVSHRGWQLSVTTLNQSKTEVLSCGVLPADRRTDTTWRHRPRLHLASRGKNDVQAWCDKQDSLMLSLPSVCVIHRRRRWVW